MKSGFVAIVGRPNAGKSTLLNSLLNEKIAITTNKAQTTRNSILGIYNDDENQIVFIDTPGIHNPLTTLGTYMNREAYSEAAGVDIIYYIVDGKEGLTSDDKGILDKLFTYDIPIFLLLNKIDEMDNSLIIKRLAYANNNYNFAEIIPLSAKNKNNLDELLKTTKTYLHDEVLYYPRDTKTPMTRNFKIAEIIREKMITNLNEEVPHLAACKVEEVIEKDNKVFIEATIICNKDTHKGIIIGKGGSMLKKINMAATSNLFKLFNKRVILSLYVKVEPDWINKEKKLFELGYFKDDKDER